MLGRSLEFSLLSQSHGGGAVGIWGLPFTSLLGLALCVGGWFGWVAGLSVGEVAGTKGTWFRRAFECESHIADVNVGVLLQVMLLCR